MAKIPLRLISSLALSISDLDGIIWFEITIKFSLQLASVVQFSVQLHRSRLVKCNFRTRLVTHGFSIKVYTELKLTEMFCYSLEY